MSMNRFLGIQNTSSHAEKLASTAGAMISIAVMAWINLQYMGFEGVLAIFPSMGASVVLLFAVPHGSLSQPWALLAGHLFSAAVGVTCYQWIDNTILAAGCAVGLSIGLMQLLRCVHPPGGATALIAVIGGSDINNLGYGYVLAPTLLNCMIVFICAMLFNNLFSWRKYPSSLMHYQSPAKTMHTYPVTVEQIRQAMDTLNEVVDIEAEEIKYIVDKAIEITQKGK